MSTQPLDTEAHGSTPGASALTSFIEITNLLVVMLSQLVDDARDDEPGTAAAIESYTAVVAGQALDLISCWPS